MKAIGPEGGIPAEKVALSGVIVSMTPKQFGPISRIENWRATSSSSRSRSAPSQPASRHPALMTMAAGMAFSPHSRSASGTAGYGMTITARSIGPGTASTDLKHGWPRIDSAVGLIGYTRRSSFKNPPRSRLFKTAWPSLVGLVEAPMTATVRGAKKWERDNSGSLVVGAI